MDKNGLSCEEFGSDDRRPACRWSMIFLPGSLLWMICIFWLVFSAICRSFDLLHRKNPFGGEYTVFAGLEECVKFAAHFAFSDDEIKYVKSILPPTCEVGQQGASHSSSFNDPLTIEWLQQLWEWTRVLRKRFFSIVYCGTSKICRCREPNGIVRLVADRTLSSTT